MTGGVRFQSPSASRQPWVDELPEALEEIRVEVHDPATLKVTRTIPFPRTPRGNVVTAGAAFDAGARMAVEMIRQKNTPQGPITTWAGGSSRVLRSALNAEVLSM